MGKYKWMIVGYVLIFGVYFGYRTYQVLTMKTAGGEVFKMFGGHNILGGPRNGIFFSRSSHRRDTEDDFPVVEVHFPYKTSSSDTDIWFSVKPQVFEDKKFQEGEKVSVIFSESNPEGARLYSFSEFWCPTYSLVILGMITFLWTAGFCVVVFKPWEAMGEV